MLRQIAGMVRISIDSDACPVKKSVSCGRALWLACFCCLQPDDCRAEHTSDRDIVITANIPPVARCVQKGSYVLEPTGRRLDRNAIGLALPMRNLTTDMRSMGVMTSPGAAFEPADRSHFLSQLDTLAVRARKL